ncbi:MAG: hypothetical protein ACLFQX_13395 [Candidatus Kapaibacterium sp.]
MKYFRVSFIMLVLLLFFVLRSTATAQEVPVYENDLIPSEKNPALAFGLSLILPGLGQMYNEDIGLGFAFTGSALLGIGLTNHHQEDVANAGYIIFGLTALISAIEAPISANTITTSSRLRKARERKKFFHLLEYRIKDTSVGFDPIMIEGGGLGISFTAHF